jgi:capsule polysaccharide export protein KpsE/RkpR
MSARVQSLTGRLSRGPILRRDGLRRLVLALLIALCGFLSFFPEKYRAAVSLTPTDPASLGLSGTLGELGSSGGVFGNQAAIEISLKVARSVFVRNIVAKNLDIENKLQKPRISAQRWLEQEVDIRIMRGGIIQFEVKLTDKVFAKQIVSAYAGAVREQLGVIAREQVAYKQRILTELVERASDKLAVTQSAYDVFRLKAGYSSPENAIAGIGDRIPRLEDALLGKKVELNTARQFATDDNMRVRQILSEIESLDDELRRVRSTSPTNENSVGQVVENSTKVRKLKRDLDIAQNLYDNYSKYLRGTPVENLTSTANVRLLEPPYIDTSRQYNFLPMALGLIILLFGMAIEFYRMRPPLEDTAAL